MLACPLALPRSVLPSWSDPINRHSGNQALSHERLKCMLRVQDPRVAKLATSRRIFLPESFGPGREPRALVIGQPQPPSMQLFAQYPILLF